MRVYGSMPDILTHNSCLQESSGRGILKNNLATFLSTRMRSLNGAQPFLPKFWNDVTDWLIRNVTFKDQQSRHTYREEVGGMLCKALVTERQKAAWNLSIMQSTATAVASFVAHFEDITATTASAAAIKAAAAAAVGDMGALRRAIKDDHCLSWQKSYPFGRPLTAATANNHIALVYSIVKYFE
jgi:hypothetical protein